MCVKQLMNKKKEHLWEVPTLKKLNRASSSLEKAITPFQQIQPQGLTSWRKADKKKEQK